MEDIILQYTWPRIDAEVSKHRNHLLKAPFCVHPKTGRVCVPVDPTRIEEFHPGKVPTVGQLLKEIDEAMVTNNEDSAEGAQHLPGKSSFSYVARFELSLSRVRRGNDSNLFDPRRLFTPTSPGRTNSGDRSIVQNHCLTSYVFADPSPHFLYRAAAIDWERTSLKPYVALLDAHNKALMEETRRRKRGDKDVNMTTSGSL